MKPTLPKIRAAFQHVRGEHPEVTHVVFFENGKWLYLSEDSDIPIFENIDVSALEDAITEAEETLRLPCVVKMYYNDAQWDIQAHRLKWRA